MDALRPLSAASLSRPEVGDVRAAPLLEPLGVHSLLRAPLLARDRCFGVMTLLATSPRRRYGPADLWLAEELASRAALALDNSRLFAEAQQAIERRDEFLLVASHELKTPLTSLKMQAHLLARLLPRFQRAEVAPERIDAAIQVLNRQIARLAHLVNELLDVTRLNAGRLLPRARAPRPGRPDARGRRAHAPAARRRPLPHPARPGRARGGRLGCFSHRAGPHQPPVQRAQVRRGEPPFTSSCAAWTDRALLVVRDHGIGIAQADQARIFERFERAVSVRNFGGLGLGLYIVRWIVASHGGTICVESAPGAGATFLVELPLRPAEAETATHGQGALLPSA